MRRFGVSLSRAGRFAAWPAAARRTAAGLAAALAASAWAGDVLPAQDTTRATTRATTPATTRATARATTKRLAQRNASRYDETFRRYTKRYFGPGFDWRLFKAQGLAESGLDPEATSYVGARGIMQLMPATYKAITSKRPDFGAINDPEWNIAAGIMHDRYLWKLWSKSISEQERPAFMFGSYNAGQGTINRARATAKGVVGSDERWAHIEQVAPTVPRWRYRETLGYVRKIDRYYADIKKPR
ncbi:MAG: transglycosylase SLT domain-containing protein [Gemmatimonadaceae bacterium]|nr:transglycosylase SLT domain-containing protein [Gemmatimonadaceae bacterium]